MITTRYLMAHQAFKMWSAEPCNSPYRIGDEHRFPFAGHLVARREGSWDADIGKYPACVGRNPTSSRSQGTSQYD